MTCCYCGRATERVCCHVCMLTHYADDPDRVPSYIPDFDDPPPAPEPSRVLALERLRETLRRDGIEPIAFPPDEPEWSALNEERFLFELAEKTEQD